MAQHPNLWMASSSTRSLHATLRVSLAPSRTVRTLSNALGPPTISSKGSPHPLRPAQPLLNDARTRSVIPAPPLLHSCLGTRPCSPSATPYSVSASAWTLVLCPRPRPAHPRRVSVVSILGSCAPQSCNRPCGIQLLSRTRPLSIVFAQDSSFTVKCGNQEEAGFRIPTCRVSARSAVENTCTHG